MIDDLSALKHEFDENGFVIVENVFTTDEFAAFDDALGKIICQRLNWAARDGCEAASKITEGDAANKGLVVLAEHDQKAFESVYDTVWQVAPFLRMVSKEHVVRLANILLGLQENSPLYGYINRCRISLPDDPSAILDWHREIFQTIPAANFVQIWAPLVHDCRRENGALWLCSKSHTAKLSKPKWLQNSNGASAVSFGTEIADRFEQIEMNLKLGQAVFFSGNILHKSGYNSSSVPRYSMVGLFHDTGDPHFEPPKAKFSYRALQPREYFNSLPDPS
jgi:ectoine hydroxylase-related dioxygenase (phytanoyl-CoA dioxygenase family)